MKSFDLDDDALLAAFEDLSLPYSKWTHKTHLRMAYICITRQGLDGGTGRIRPGIQAFNAHNKIPDGPLMGYHETLTVAWMRILESQIRRLGPWKDSREFVESQPHLWSRTLLRLFYSKDCLMQPRAKSEFVEPDLTRLPA